MSMRRPWMTAVWILAALAGLGWSSDPWPERRQRIETLTPAEKEELRRRQERFATLEPAEQDRLRRLHRDLEQDPEATHLRMVMDRYCRWLATLSPYRRAELLQAEPGERIKRIKAMLDEQAQREAKRLGSQDIAALTGWMDKFAGRHEARLLEMLSENQRQNLQKAAPAVRQRMLFAMVWWRWQRGAPSRGQLLTDEDLAELKTLVSADARAHLEGKSPVDQRAVVIGWIRQMLQHHLASADIKSLLPAISDEDLSRFFEKEISDQQRDHLLSLPNEELQRELRQMYVLSKRGGEIHTHGDRDRPGRLKKPAGPDGGPPLKPKKHPWDTFVPKDAPPSEP